MAPAPVIGNCYRIDLDWPTLSGVKPHNTFHILTSTADLDDIATAIGDAHDAVSGNIWDFLYTGYNISSIDITPLDGHTARTSHLLGTTFSGGSSGGLLPAVCNVVSMRTTQRGARGRGRLYVGPTGEEDVTDGLFTGASSMGTKWQSFMAHLASGSANISLAVVSYVHGDANGVVSISCDEIAGTMRRRQDQLR